MIAPEQARSGANEEDERTDDMKPVLVSIADAARMLGIGKTKAYALIQEQELDTVLIGTRRLVTISSIERLVETASMGEVA